MEPNAHHRQPASLMRRVAARVSAVVAMAARLVLAGWIDDAPTARRPGDPLPSGPADRSARGLGARLGRGLTTAALAAVLAVTPAAAQGPQSASRDGARAPRATGRVVDRDEASVVTAAGSPSSAERAEPTAEMARRTSIDVAFDARGTLRKPLSARSAGSGVRPDVIVYRVQRGDTVSSIAEGFGVTWMTIWWANRLIDLDTIAEGDTLRIMPSAGIRHLVRDGDTLDSIARAYDADPALVAEANDLEGEVVVLGQRLFIPEGRGARYRPIPDVSPLTPVPRLRPGQAGRAAEEAPGLAAPLNTAPVASTLGVKDTGGLAWPLDPDWSASLDPGPWGSYHFEPDDDGGVIVRIPRVSSRDPATIPQEPARFPRGSARLPPASAWVAGTYLTMPAEAFADTFAEAFSDPQLESPLDDGAFYLRDVPDRRLADVRTIVLHGNDASAGGRRMRVQQVRPGFARVGIFDVHGTASQVALFAEAVRLGTYPMERLAGRITVRFGPTPPRPDHGPSWGYAYLSSRAILLRPELTRDQAAYTLLHEIGHFVDRDVLTRMQRRALMSLMEPTPGTRDDQPRAAGDGREAPRTTDVRIPVAKPPADAPAHDPHDWPEGGPPAGPPRGRMLETDDARLTLTLQKARRQRSLAWPVAGGGSITQRFQPGHRGLDIAARWGTPVVAAHDGIVVYRGWRDDRGANEVWIKHGPRLYTIYAHLAGFAVRKGQWVEQGQVIAAMGSTGYSTGPHLHFGVSVGPVPDWDAAQRDPMHFLH